MANVGKYTIHGSYGIDRSSFLWAETSDPHGPLPNGFHRPWTWPSCVCALCWWSASLGKNLGIFFFLNAWEKHMAKKMWFALEKPRTKKKHMVKRKRTLFFGYGGETISFLFDGGRFLATNSQMQQRYTLRFCDWPGGLFGRYQVRSAHYKWDNYDPRRASDVRWAKSPLNGDICFHKIQVCFHEPSACTTKNNQLTQICLTRFDTLRTFDPMKCLSWLLLIQRFRSPTSFCI